MYSLVSFWSVHKHFEREKMNSHCGNGQKEIKMTIGRGTDAKAYQTKFTDGIFSLSEEL